MRDEVLVIGGGVAGCASAIGLARKGRRVTLIEREAQPRHKVCGELLSGEALEELRALGIVTASIGAVSIDRVRLAVAGRAAEAYLPFPAASLTRKALDTILLKEAVAAGARVVQGRRVQAVSYAGSHHWRTILDDGTEHDSTAVFLATGKHDLREFPRRKDPHKWVAYKMYFRLSKQQTAELAGASELMLYSGGYGGLQPVEGGLANLCCIMQQKHLARVGHRWENFLARAQQQCPHLAMRLKDAEPMLVKPIAISQIPYGYLRRKTEEGLYCVGDQAAVIPSFTGDGISIALHTARCAVSAFDAGMPAPLFQERMRSSLFFQMRIAKLAADGLNNTMARAVLPYCLRILPGVMRMTASLTRVAQRDIRLPHTIAL